MYGLRLKEVREKLNLTQKDFSEKLKITQATLSKYEHDQQNVPVELLSEISKNFNVSSEYLLNAEGEVFYSSKGKIIRDDGNTSYIELLSGSVSAGRGIENFEISVIDKIPVPSTMIRPYTDDKVKSLRVKGDSMMPTVSNGDIIFYVPGESRDNNIYVIEVFGELKCKRIEFRLNGDIIVISDNTKYEKEIFKKENQTLQICGVVIAWTHKNIY